VFLSILMHITMRGGGQPNTTLYDGPLRNIGNKMYPCVPFKQEVEVRLSILKISWGTESLRDHPPPSIQPLYTLPFWFILHVYLCITNLNLWMCLILSILVYCRQLVSYDSKSSRHWKYLYTLHTYWWPVVEWIPQLL